MSARRGFTLLELLVVIALLGLSFGLVFLRLDSMVPSMRLSSSARALGSHLEQARNYAVVSGRPVTFAYDLENRGYRYFHPFELAEDGQTVLGEGETDIVDWVLLADTIVFQDVTINGDEVHEAGVYTVTFEPRGTVNAHMVHLRREEAEHSYTVRVSPLLGHVDVEQGYREMEFLDEDAFD